MVMIQHSLHRLRMTEGRDRRFCLGVIKMTMDLFRPVLSKDSGERQLSNEYGP